MMPVPTHLMGIARPRESTLDETPLVADAVCPCGANRFKVLYYRDPSLAEQPKFPQTVRGEDGEFYFIVRIDCVNCGRSHLLFDSNLHGWDALATRGARQPRATDLKIAVWECSGCSHALHAIEIWVNTIGQEELQDSKDIIPENRWWDAFDWISISIRCCGCGRETRNWADCETM